MLLLHPGADGPDAPALPEESIEEFFQACGGRQPLRLTVYNPDGQDVDCHHFERPYLLIGHSDECDLRLAHPDVEERHAYLQMVNGLVTCYRISRNVADLGRAEPELLAHGDDIEIGPYRIQLTGDEFSEADATEEPPTSRSVVHAASLRFLNSRNRRTKGKALPLTETVTLIGRSKLCHVRLADKTVSRVHCGLIVAKDGVWVVDLLSSAGIQVDERYVAFRRLEDGDELQVGKFRISLDIDVSDVLPLPTNETGETPPPSIEQVVPKLTSSAAQAASPPQTEPQPAPAAEPSMRVVPPRAEPVSALSRPNPAPAPTQGFSEGFVMSLVNQFAMMQQQSFLQMQQMVAAMLEAMSDSHREHVSLIRDELRKIDDISHELLEIRQQMSAQEASAATQQPAQTLAEAPSEVPPLPRIEEQPQPAEPEDAELEVAENTEPEVPEAEPAETAAPMLSPDRSEEILKDFAASTKSKREEKSTKRSNFDEDGRQIHANLLERMAALDRERNSRWQKILGMLTGAESGR